MVYLKNWSDFESVRYCVKFRPKEGHLVLKVTDDVKCLKYKTYSSIILNRFEALNLRLLTSMASPRARAVPVATPTPAAGAEEVALVTSEQKTGVDPAAGTGKGASKKKKKGKK
ncbi:hypothetical protein QFC20_001082 [Naganishia adeliensis]|uniref:Uncharacterized protein n=1 Tax=Naganishia adeliensis TaxID=92952 RepID=A0ACC2WVM4_9TREE|nr:hypothetical protein QFC20_001082 [Naganishia adeliensis]